jgi:hypothetical protein
MVFAGNDQEAIGPIIEIGVELADEGRSETIRRLVAEGAFEMRPNRSVRVPLMTRAKVLELRDIRMALEGLAAKQAAKRIKKEEVGGASPDCPRDRCGA